MAAGTAPGSRAEPNEDRFWIDSDRKAFIVADGAGGEGFAAEAFVEGARAVLESGLTPGGAISGQSVPGVLVEAARQGDLRTHETLEREELIMGGGAVAMLGVVASDNNILMAYAGNCRLYRYQSGRESQRRLTLLSRDHTWTQEMLDQGKLTREQAQGHSLSRVWTRCVGEGTSFPFDLLSNYVALGQLYLVCTDGVWRGRQESSLMEALDYDRLEDAVRELCHGRKIAADGSSWGEDDATAVVLRIDSVDAERFA